MIRLFASDIDGTMLADNSTELDPIYFKTIREMKDSGAMLLVLGLFGIQP